MTIREVRVPWFAVLLVVLASFRFERHNATSSLTYDGPVIGFGVVVIIGIVILFKLSSRWVDYLVLTGRISERPHFHYDALIVACIATMFTFYYCGDLITGMTGQAVPSWVLESGQNEARLALILGIVGLALLLRVHTIMKAIVEERRAGADGGD